MCQITFNDIPAENKTETIEQFGCCSQYRKCSEQKKCLFPNDESHKGCLYKANLEQGKVFYGKDAPGFNIEKYSMIKESYFSLSEANQETALRLFLYAIQKLTVSCRLFCTFEQDIYEFLTNANNLSSLGLQYVGDINSYTQCMSIPQMRGIIADCDLDLKFNRRSKAATIFAQNDTLKKYVLNKYLYIKFEKDYVKYYIELFHEVFNQFPQMNKSGLTDIAYITTSKELSSKS